MGGAPYDVLYLSRKAFMFPFSCLVSSLGCSATRLMATRDYVVQASSSSSARLRINEALFQEVLGKSRLEWPEAPEEEFRRYIHDTCLVYTDKDENDTLRLMMSRPGYLDIPTVMQSFCSW